MTAAALSINLSHLFDNRVTNAVYRPLFQDTHRFLVLVGGGGSGKSIFAAQKQVVRLVTCKARIRLGVVRKVARTIRASVFQEILDVIDGWNWRESFAVNKSDMTITFKPTGSQFVFVGLDDVEKLKSIKGICSWWVEEATEITEGDLDQLNIRLRGKLPTYKQILLTFNPIFILHWIKRRFWDTPQHDRTRTIKTTYLDNRFLDAEDAATYEIMKVQNPALYKVYGLGEWGNVEGLIYDTPLYDTYPESFPDECYGLDFGFNHATALTHCGFKDATMHPIAGDVYLRETVYGSGLTTPDLIAAMESEGVDKDTVIWADSAEPDRIAEIRKSGYNIKAAKKGPGSVNAGLDVCRALTLHTCDDNVNINREFSSYSWQQNATGDWIDKPVKFADDGMDSIRYGIYSQLSKGNRLGSFDRRALGV